MIRGGSSWLSSATHHLRATYGITRRLRSRSFLLRSLLPLLILLFLLVYNLMRHQMVVYLCFNDAYFADGTLMHVVLRQLAGLHEPIALLVEISQSYLPIFCFSVVRALEQRLVCLAFFSWSTLWLPRWPRPLPTTLGIVPAMHTMLALYS